ncbi:flippase-like domain-containing protein [Patescibacteria group bacterium]|nr:flippase-like domain-containing protein [Patescibacteria group bacterium]
MKVPVKTILRISVSAILIIYIIRTQDFLGILKNSITINPLIFLVALVFLLLGTVFSALRWKEILKTSNKNLPFFKLFSLYLKGYFYNNFLPTQMGGDFYKAVSLSSSINDKSIAFFSVFVDRFAGLIVLLLMGIYGISLKLEFFYTAILLFLTVVGFVLYFPFLKILSKKIKVISKFYEASLLLVKNKKSGLLILFFSVLVQIVSFAMSYTLFTGFGIFLNLQDVFAFMPLISLSLLLPSFNGWGAQEAVYAKIFGLSYISEPISIAVSLLIQAIRIIMSLIGGVFILFNIGKLKKEI